MNLFGGAVKKALILILFLPSVVFSSGLVGDYTGKALFFIDCGLNVAISESKPEMYKINFWLTEDKDNYFALPIAEVDKALAEDQEYTFKLVDEDSGYSLVRIHFEVNDDGSLSSYEFHNNFDLSDVKTFSCSFN